MLTQADLSQFIGTTQYYMHSFKRFTYTDGVKYLAEKADAYWLLDAIASHQPQLLNDPMLQYFQHWKLTVINNTAKLICEKGSNIIAATQDIPFTDFPLSSVQLFLIEGVLMLPSEY